MEGLALRRPQDATLSRRSACDRCRGHKLRCNRDSSRNGPCLRCRRAKASCITTPTAPIGIAMKDASADDIQNGDRDNTAQRQQERQTGYSDVSQEQDLNISNSRRHSTLEKTQPKLVPWTQIMDVDSGEPDDAEFRSTLAFGVEDASGNDSAIIRPSLYDLHDETISSRFPSGTASDECRSGAITAHDPLTTPEKSNTSTAGEYDANAMIESPWQNFLPFDGPSGITSLELHSRFNEAGNNDPKLTNSQDTVLKEHHELTISELSELNKKLMKDLYLAVTQLENLESLYATSPDRSSEYLFEKTTEIMSNRSGMGPGEMFKLGKMFITTIQKFSDPMPQATLDSLLGTETPLFLAILTGYFTLLRIFETGFSSLLLGVGKVQSPFLDAEYKPTENCIVLDGFSVTNMRFQLKITVEFAKGMLLEIEKAMGFTVDNNGVASKPIFKTLMAALVNQKDDDYSGDNKSGMEELRDLIKRVEIALN